MSKPHLRYRKQTGRERTLTIHLISLEKTVKATLLIVVALKLLSFLNGDVHAWAADFVTRHGIDSGNRFVVDLLDRLVGVGNEQLITWSVIAFLYAAMLYVEGIGLWLQKRWAEYLTVIATTLLLPVEVYEIFEKFTWVRIGIFVINVFIVWYLTTRLRDENREIARSSVEETAPEGI